MTEQWVRKPVGGRDGGWKLQVSEPWRHVYAMDGELSVDHDAFDEALLRLGAAGWELVTAVDYRRDQHVEQRSGGVAVSGHSTAAAYLFKRPSTADAVEEHAQAEQLRLEAAQRAERTNRERAADEARRAERNERLLDERRARLDPAGDRMIQLIDAYWFWRAQGTTALESAASELGLSVSEATRLMNEAGAEALQARRPTDL